MRNVSQPQPSSDGFGIARPDRPDEVLSASGPPVSRYDLLLAILPLVLLLAWTIGQVTSVPLWATLAVGSLFAIPLLADGLLLNPPR